MKRAFQMNPMKKVMVFSGLIMAPLLIALAIWLGPHVIEAFTVQKYLAGFEKIQGAKTPLTIAQVEDVLGSPTRTEQSESADQTIHGAVYHYATYGTDIKIVFVNGAVFRTEFLPGAKS
jgi:hypothetical protein